MNIDVKNSSLDFIFRSSALAHDLLPLSGSTRRKKNMKTRIAAMTLIGALAVSPAIFADTKKADTQAEMQKEAKISMEKAKEIALKQVSNGKIKSSELEREHGKLIYSFDITVAGKSGVTEVNVDAITGNVISSKHETPAKEAAEKKQESKEKKH
jgi:uncharacterized membrane protein YkoI